ncbi:hypothetical protein GCM10010300_85880 [Streptomyces olivaceoviridis]|nr:hypothetical protein GCM10010300_85880 [Streptomyces olivaceoviridis]
MAASALGETETAGCSAATACGAAIAPKVRTAAAVTARRLALSFDIFACSLKITPKAGRRSRASTNPRR